MDFRDVGHVFRGYFDAGRLKVQSDGLYFKALKSGKVFQIPADNVESVEWMPAARGCELKVMAKDGTVTKFSGFKNEDFVELKNFLKSNYHKDLQLTDVCVKGWNWGDLAFQDSLMSFNIDSKAAFQVPMNEVSQVTSGKNEVVMEFHLNEDSPLSLVEMRFHVPHTSAPQVSEETAEGEVVSAGPDPVKELRDKILAKADVIQAIGDAIVTFSEIHCLTPRGRYSVKIYPSFLQLHGKTFDYKIPHKSILRLFLLPHNDQRQMYFVIQLDPPLRQGQTRYYFVIFLLPINEECDVVLSITNEEIKERYGGDTKIQQEMSGAFYQLFSRVMKVLVGKKVTIPGAFKNKNDQCAINCSNRATSGYLYPLDKGFIFVHKPALYIKFDGISSVNFARMTGGAGVSKSFDFEVEMKDGNAHHFSSLMKEDYDRLSQFVSEKNLRVKNKGKAPERMLSYNDEGSSDSDHDAYLARMKAEGEDKDSEDEDSDFVAGDSAGSADEFEYDTDAKPSEGSGDESKEASLQKVKHSKRKASPAAPKSSKKAKIDNQKVNKSKKAKDSGAGPSTGAKSGSKASTTQKPIKSKKAESADQSSAKFKSAEFVSSDADDSSVESTNQESDEDPPQKTERRTLRSGGDNEKLVSLPSEGEDESEPSASDSDEEQSSSGSDS